MAQTKANKLLDNTDGHSSSTVRHSGLRGTHVYSTESDQATARASPVHEFDAVVFAWTEDGKFPPGNETPTIRATPSKKEDQRNSPFHNEDIIARFSDLLHWLCSGMLEQELAGTAVRYRRV